MSGPNGLYRYDMNDVVEVTGFYNLAPQIAFVRKGRDMASITGEKIHLNQVQAAVRTAEVRSRASVRQFRVIPDIRNSRYDLLVEFSASHPDDFDRFVRDFDQALSTMNAEWACKRASHRLGSPRLCVMRREWSDRVAASDCRNGKREAQYKWPQLTLEWDETSRREVVETFLSDLDANESEYRTGVLDGDSRHPRL
jgi:hypothetical protein